MLVVSDTSPLNYLVLIQAVDVLPVLFSEVFIPPAVLDELSHLHAPEAVREWVQTPPYWLQVRTPLHVQEFLKLGRGESEAIALAEELCAGSLLVDERNASRVASQRGIEVVGTFSVLAKAIVLGLADRDTVVGHLEKTNFRGPISLLDELITKFRSSR